jgi:hypothetical protein
MLSVALCDATFVGAYVTVTAFDCPGASVIAVDCPQLIMNGCPLGVIVVEPGLIVMLAPPAGLLLVSVNGNDFV